MLRLLSVILLLTCPLTCPAELFRFEPSIPSEHALEPKDLAVIINSADPLSATLGEYYIAKRKIPRHNVIYISFPPGRNVMSREQFAIIKKQVDDATPFFVQAYALTWVAPYRVDCMSITTAFAMGFDPAFCAQGCVSTKLNPYFNSLSHRPWSDYGIRPTMSIAATNLENGIKLIKQGVNSDYTYPFGTGYLLSTSDRNRTVRSHFYADILQHIGAVFLLQEIEGDTLKDKHDVFFYFTGLTKVSDLDTLTFLPGAIADHLTSAGGVLNGTGQMSALRWLEAGATGSYGAVVEPCNFPQKFPHPRVVMQHYLNGDSLIEAYWKSVAWPGQGIFIGEPLAKPFALY